MRGIVKVAVAVAAMATPAVLIAAPAQAAPKEADLTPRHAPCGTAGPNLDNRVVTGATAGARLRTGSSTSCTARGSAQPSDRLDYYCFTLGNDGYTWTYLRDQRTGVLGWVRDTLLPVRDGVRGSNRHCGF